MELLTPQSFQAVGNCAFISLKSATQDGYERDSGIYVQPDNNKRVEEAAASVGMVVAVGPNLNIRLSDGSLCEIKLVPGDLVAVDYRVVSKGQWEGDRFCHESAWIIKEQLVWKAEVYSLIAVKDGDKWRALGDHVLLKPAKEEVVTSSSIIIPEMSKTKEVKGRAVHISGLDLPEGKEVAYNHQFGSVYQFTNGEEFIVVQREYIFGTID